jgi:hypothetical protein
MRYDLRPLKKACGMKGSDVVRRLHKYYAWLHNGEPGKRFVQD